MKNKSKKLLSCALAAAMSLSVGSAFANTVSVTKVEVLKDTNNAEGSVVQTVTSDFANANISLDSSQLLRVTVEMKNGETPAAGEISFLSNKTLAEGENLDNNTIQYVDQQTSADGTAVVTFRPRTTIGIGTFEAKAGGTDTATPASFNYTVKAPDIELKISGNSSATITEGENAKFRLLVGRGKELPTAVTVKEGETVCDTEYNDGDVTVKNLTKGTHNLVISADGYTSVSVTVIVNEKVASPIPDGDKEGAESGFSSGMDSIKDVPEVDSSDNSVTLPDKVTVGENDYSYKYEIKGENANVTIEGNKIKLKDNVFAAKVEIEASIGTEADGIKATKTLYIIPEGTQVAYGNLNLVSDSNGADAFSDDTSFSTFVGSDSSSAEKIEMLANAINITLGRQEEPIQYITDYDKDGKTVLAEYRILKLMLDGKEGYKPSDVSNARANFVKSK